MVRNENFPLVKIWFFKGTYSLLFRFELPSIMIASSSSSILHVSNHLVYLYRELFHEEGTHRIRLGHLKRMKVSSRGQVSPASVVVIFPYVIALIRGFENACWPVVFLSRGIVLCQKKHWWFHRSNRKCVDSNRFESKLSHQELEGL